MHVAAAMGLAKVTTDRQMVNLPRKKPEKGRPSDRAKRTNPGLWQMQKRCEGIRALTGARLAEVSL